MNEKLKLCPFCNGSVTQIFDDCGGSWIEHDLKHKDGSIDTCILTGIHISTTSSTHFTWDSRGKGR